MSLRTYSLITHPAFLRFVETATRHADEFAKLPPADVPEHFPRISTPYDLAEYLNVNPLMIRSFSSNKLKHYRIFEVDKRSGGKREICAPRTFLKVAQWWILDTILENKSDLPFLYGFSKGKGFVDNARQHFGCSYLLNVDIKDFFPSVRSQLVTNVFQSLGYNDKVSQFLSEICTLEGSLPQGAPTSPKLSNFAFEQCDLKLRNLSISAGLHYTRYADDMTFSGPERIPLSVVEDVRGILAEAGFVLNESKTRFMGRNQAKEVTGIILGRDSIALPREYLNSTRGWFHRVRAHPEFYPNERLKILGTINLLEQVGGRGSKNLIESGRAAAAALSGVTLPKLEWGKD